MPKAIKNNKIKKIGWWKDWKFTDRGNYLTFTLPHVPNGDTQVGWLMAPGTEVDPQIKTLATWLDCALYDLNRLSKGEKLIYKK